MGFRKYPHIEKLGRDEVDGILIGKIYIQPKIDGANVSLWPEDRQVFRGTRNQSLGADGDHAGFKLWVDNNKEKILELFSKFPTWRLYAEFLIPHSLKTYRDDAWRKVYTFDVFDDHTECFIPYGEYLDVIKEYELPYIPTIAVLENAAIEDLGKYLDNTFLIKDGEGFGEGIVIKNYNFVNRYGRVTWAKIVRNEFKDENMKAFGPRIVTLMEGQEIKFVNRYVDHTLIDKVVTKIEFEKLRKVESKDIPELFSRIYYDLVNENIWDFLKMNKYRVTLDFGVVLRLVIDKVKEYKKELF
jgi:hypothetical protein